MFCFHDWHNHRSTYESFRAHILFDFPREPFPMLAVFGMGGLYAVAGGLLLQSGMAAAISSIVAMAVMTNFLVRNARARRDPWAVSDRTCLKCGKVEFNLTKQEENDALKRQIQDAEYARRRELTDIADEAFEKKAKLRRMAQA